MDNKQQFKTLVTRNFAKSHEGVKSRLVLRSSAELSRDYREFVDINKAEVTDVMIDAGYEIVSVSGLPYWVLYAEDAPNADY